MPADAPPTLLTGTTLGRYRIERRLGAGGMGEVYEALHLDLNRRVAVKTLLPSAASKPVAVARFLREGQATARLRHPHAIEVFDVGMDRDVVFLVMELLDGETFAALIARESPLAPARIAALMLPVLAAVQAAHEEGVVHRDLKPANLFLHRARDGRIVPKVLDFGVSKVVDEDVTSLTQSEAVLGTPYYMSPEQLQGAKYVDARSDQYTLGVILYECATQRKPFVGETVFVVMNAIASGRFAPPREVVPSLSPAFEAEIVRAMSLDPGARFESVCALGRALLPFAEDRVRASWESTFAVERPASAALRRASAPPPPASAASKPQVSVPAPPPRDLFADPLSTSVPWSSALREAAPGGPGSPGTSPSPKRVSRRVVGAVAASVVIVALTTFALRRGASGPPPTSRSMPVAVARAAPPDVFMAPAQPASSARQPVVSATVSAVTAAPSTPVQEPRRTRGREPRRGYNRPGAPADPRVGTNSIPILR